MRKLIYIITAVFLLSMIQPVLAQQEPAQKYNKIYLEPFYRESLNPDTPYAYTVDVSPPDKVGEVLSAIITFSVWHNPTIRYTLTVNGQSCINPSFLVHTSYENAGNNEILFDCSNIITNAGTYDIVLTPDDDTGTITGWLDFTYSNKPRGNVEVHGTEYIPGQNAKIWLQLIDDTGEDVIDGVCYLDVYTPDNLELLEDATMTNMVHDGIYYYDLTAPQQSGVYPAIARCYYEATQTISNATAYAIYEGKYDDGVLSDLDLIDGNYFKLDTDDNIGIRGNEQLDVNFTYGDFYSVCGGVSEELLSSLSISWTGKWNTNDVNHDIIISIWNYTAMDWLELPNEIGGGNGGDIFSVSDSLETNNITTALGITSSNPAKIRLRDTDTTEGKKDFDSDQLVITCDELSNPEWQEVKGSSEMHITSDQGYTYEMILGELTNETAFNYFYFTYEVFSQTFSAESEVDVELDTFNAFPCDHVYNVSVLNDTSGNYDTYPEFSKTLINGGEGCKVHFDYNLEPATNYFVKVESENYWKRRLYTDLANTYVSYDSVAVGCWNYALLNNLTNYTIPSTAASPHFTNNFYNLCQGYLDWFYQHSLHVTPFLQIAAAGNVNFTNDEMESLEASWAHLLSSSNKGDDYATTYAQALVLMGQYSEVLLSNELPFQLNGSGYDEFFANLSTNHLEYIKQINVSEISSSTANQVWNYSDRQLTDFQFDVVNETEIAESVWNWDGTIVANILDQIATSIWSYTGAIASAITDAISNSVWSASDRNLTFTPDQNITTQTVEVLNQTVNVTTQVLNLTVQNQTVEVLNQTVNVTVLNQTVEVVNQTVNVTTQVLNLTVQNQTVEVLNQTVDPQEFWEYNDRTLTSFNFTVDTSLNLTDINASDIAEAIWQYDGNVSSNLVTQFGDYTSCLIESLLNINDGWGISIRTCI